MNANKQNDGRVNCFTDKTLYRDTNRKKRYNNLKAALRKMDIRTD